MSCRIRRCQLCQDWLNPLSAILKCVIHFHIFWTIWHIVSKIGRDHQHHVPEVPQKYEDSATYCSRGITILEKMLNFWKCYLKCIRLMLSCSLGYADSENVSFVIFQNSVCPPYWSKWTTVFSLLLLENLSNSSQNCLRWSLDWAEQNLLNIIFWPLVKKKVMMFWTTTSTQNWFGGCNLGQTLINRNETWYASSKPRSEGKYQSWEQRHLWVLR